MLLYICRFSKRVYLQFNECTYIFATLRHYFLFCFFFFLLHQARLLEKDNPKQLIIALEPEAAGVFCRNLEVNELVEEARASMKTVQLPVGSKYLVVDAGGECRGKFGITLYNRRLIGRQT